MHSPGLAGQTETFVRFGVTPRLELGFGYLWKQGIARPLATYNLVPETATRPALTAGLLMDSLGGGRQGVFASLAKNIEASTGVPASLYVGAAKISNERGTRFIAGTNVRLSRNLNASAQFDGRYVNVGLNTQIGTVGGLPVRFGLVAARGDQVGPLVSTVVPLGERPMSGHP